MSEIVRAPFTRDQVMALNRWQDYPFVHPYTCGNNSSHVLVATVRGWICPFCDYTQDWASALLVAEMPGIDDYFEYLDEKTKVFGETLVKLLIVRDAP